MADSHVTLSSVPTGEAQAWLAGVEADIAALAPEQRVEIQQRAERFDREVAEIEAGHHPLQRDHAAE